MRGSLGILILLSGTAGCSSTDTDSRKEVLASLGQAVILDGYQTFSQDTLALHTASSAFCSAPDENSLEQAQAAWDKARESWKRMEVFAFGPYVKYPDRLGPNIDFWPARGDLIGEVLADDDAITTESMPSRGAARRGLPVLEYLLYAEKDASLDAFSSQDRRCEYLMAASADLNHLALAMLKAWDPAQQGYLKELTEPHSGSMYMNSQEAMSEVVNRMAFSIEDIRRDKLGAPLGDTQIGIAHPESVESFYSGRSLKDIRDVLSTIEVLFSGSEKKNARGLVSLPSLKERKDLIDAFSAKFGQVTGDLDAIDGPLSSAVQEQPAFVERAIKSLGELQTLIHADVMNVLGLSIAFNDTDGD
ncbi:MAG: imelysin family protein [Myxococcales bacterium]|nr:imelysin family protein [Myxococcales bacterium]